jgi:cytochrome P450
MRTTVELAVAAAPAWPALRLLSSPATVRAFPSLAILLGLAVTIGLTLLAAVALLVPALLLPVAVTALVFLAAERVRARRSYGRRRRLPPGSLGLGRTAPFRHVGFYAAEARRHGPVFKLSQLFRPTVCVVGLHEGSETLRRHDAQLRTPAIPLSGLVPRGSLRYMPPHDHAVYRRLLHEALRSTDLDRAATTARAAARRELGTLAAAGLSPSRSDLDRIAFPVLVESLFGLDPDGEPAAWMHELRERLPIENVLLRRRRARRSLRELCTLARSERGEPSVLAALGERADDTAVGNLVLMLRTGGADLTSLLHWVLYELALAPSWLERVREDPDASRRVVLETLRLEQSEWILRRADADLDLAGYRVPRGWLIRVCVRESHRDPRVFPNPERFHPDRFIRRPGSRKFAPFGISRVTCLGDRLTLVVAQALVEELAEGFELRLLDGGRRVFRGMHWAPGPDFRVELVARG